ncbi:hypothetical protein TSAR_011924 [Trichomalopsis sarcophagae]|uniref:Uncharacterized protein n=1 Tax=Trichomalopsis sarcophagae TaxID=543379 RepID=A0A232EMQ2_9HYME|nr:hypothetical protein TSAR_011924 [Trichomalopsis sarcophagae]
MKIAQNTLRYPWVSSLLYQWPIKYQRTDTAKRLLPHPAFCSSTEVANFLLSTGACISLKNAAGNIPLHTAFRLRYNLREVGNPALLYIPENPVGDEGYPPFHIACQIGDLAAVKEI